MRISSRSSRYFIHRSLPLSYGSVPVSRRSGGSFLHLSPLHSTPFRNLGSLGEWWKTFKKEFKEQITPIPDPPGYINTAPFNPSRWERMPSEDFRYAIRLAWREYKEDFSFLSRSYNRITSSSSSSSSSSQDPSIAGTSTTSTSDTGSSSSSTPADTIGSNLAAVMVNTSKLLSKQGLPQTSEEIRNVSIATAKKLMTISKDKGFQDQLTQLSAEGLKTARECLDQFLIGYTEGKNAEILAYIKEQSQHENEFLQKVQAIQKQLESLHQNPSPTNPSVTPSSDASVSSTVESFPNTVTSSSPSLSSTTTASSSSHKTGIHSSTN